MALDAGASPAGNWSGCHAVAWDQNAPEFGDPAVGDAFQKHSYPIGIVVNSTGRRFLDEGADFRNFTYARYGRKILEQPGHFAWQVFDGKTVPLLRDEYRIKQVTKVRADSLEELSRKLDGVDHAAFIGEVTEFNAAVCLDNPFNPNILDGLRTRGLRIDKTNWANRLDQPPYEAYQVTCGITFTFGGLRINPHGQVLNTDLAPLSGLFAAGEIVGGLFYFNYPGGTGLTAGSVLGRIAGYSSAEER
jgi:tricarballylate dehydrogenase